MRKRQTAGETFVSPAVFRSVRRLERDQGEAVIFLGKVGVGIAPDTLRNTAACFCCWTTRTTTAVR